MEGDCSLLNLPFLLISCLCVVAALLPVLVSSFVYHSASNRVRRGRLKGVEARGSAMNKGEACVGEVSSTSPSTSKVFICTNTLLRRGECLIHVRVQHYTNGMGTSIQVLSPFLHCRMVWRWRQLPLGRSKTLSWV